MTIHRSMLLPGRAEGRTGSQRMLVVLSAGLLLSTIGARRARAQGMTPDVLEKTKNATVMVVTAYSKSKEGDTDYGSGSGFFVNSTGLAITNNHVVDPGHQKSAADKFRLKEELGRLVWTVVTDSGTEEELEHRAAVLYQNEKADLAVLQVRDEDGEFLETPDYVTFYPTTEVTRDLKTWCLGFPGGDSRKGGRGDHPVVAVTSGNIVGLPRTASGRVTMISTDVLANPGNSGGPFVDAGGRLVGVLTLGGQSEARTNDTNLIPGDLVQEMIRTAFQRGKIAGNIDLRPFYDLFVANDRIWRIPSHERLENRDCINMDNGSRLCGSATESKLTWPSPLGNIEVPASAMAYVLVDEEQATAFLDGGDRFLINSEDAAFRFTPTGSDPIEVDVDRLAAISFRKPKTQPQTPKEPVWVISGDDYRLSLAEVTGKVVFETELGITLKVPAGNVTRIEDEDGDRILHTKGGSRMLGSFEAHELHAKLVWSGTEITFTLEELENVSLQTIDYAQHGAAREIDLAEILKGSDPRLVEIARLIDAHQLSAAKPRLETLLEAGSFRSLSKETKEQLQAINGELLLRSGEYSEAAAVFQKLRRAKANDVLWHARSRLAILDRYQDGRFESAFISQPEVFERAGRDLAAEYSREGKLKLEEIERGTVESRSDYMKTVKRAKETEELLLIANRFTRGATEEFVVRLWRTLANVHRGEVVRLQEEKREIQAETRDRGRRRNEYRQRQFDQKISRIDRYIESAQEARAEVQEKLDQAGFIIDDPDRDVGDDRDED